LAEKNGEKRIEKKIWQKCPGNYVLRFCPGFCLGFCLGFCPGTPIYYTTPEVHYRPSEAPTRVFRDVLKYVHANSDYAGVTLLNRANFSSIFPFIYFDLTKQPTDIKDGMTKLTFKYTLSGSTNAPYLVYALVLYEQDLK